MTYFRKHWRGELSLGVSFWANNVAINVILGLVSILNSKQVFTDYPVYIYRINLIMTFLALLFILPWQVVGLWRSGTNHVKRSGRHWASVTVKILVILVVFTRFGYVAYCWPTYKNTFRIAFVKDTTINYSIKLLADNTVVHFDGGFPFGVSKELKKVLDANPNIELIILDSFGGRLYEARKIADLILQHKLNTCTIRGCFSDAILPFAAGKNRYLGRRARLGFYEHYNPNDFPDTKSMCREYKKDWGFYLLRGVTRDFQENLFAADPNDYWFPSQKELYDGGMIHAMVELPTILPMEEAIVFGYDTSRAASTPALSETVTDEQVKRWILTCSGVLWERNREDFITLAGREINKINIQNEKELLSEWWGIKDRKDLLDCLYGLTQRGGHNDDFLRDAQRVAGMTDEQLQAFFENTNVSADRRNEYRIAHQYGGEVGEKGILAWETTRYICLCRNGFLCGWLDEKTVWELMIPIARHVQQKFSNWQETGQNYLIGRRYWSLEQMKKDGGLFEDAISRLMEMPSSPWNRCPWDLDLSRAYELIVDPLPKDSVVTVPDVNEPADSNEIAPKINIPQLTTPELASLDFSKVNTIEELQKNGPVLVVPDEYATIQAAVNATQKGDTVFVRAGRYSGEVLLSGKEDVRIVGENAVYTVLTSTDPNLYHTVHLLKSKDIIVSDMTIIKAPGSLIKQNCALNIRNSSFHVVRCRISNVDGDGLQCYDSAKGAILDTRVESCQSNGVMIAGGKTQVTLTDCSIRDNKEAGIWIYLGATAEIRNTQAENNTNGIYISQKDSTSKISNCIIRNNSRNGVTVWDQSRVEMEDTTIVSNRRVGLRIMDKHTQAACVRLKSLNNKYGIIVEKGGTLNLEQSTVSENEAYGMGIRGSGTVAKVSGMWCGNNKTDGVTIYQGASAEISESMLSANGQTGIAVGTGGSATVTSCTIERNTFNGFFIQSKGSWSLVENNDCVENGKSGIRIYDGASAEARSNVCQNNKQNGIDVYHNEATTSLINNHCIQNQRFGILINDKAKQVEVKQNICSKNSKSGIAVGEKSRAEAIGNICEKNEWSGIQVSDYASSILQKNSCTENGQSGIIIYGKASAELQENQCFGNGHHGILFYEGATGSITHCISDKNVRSGIYVSSKETQADVLNNECCSNTYNGIVICDEAQTSVQLINNKCLGNYPSGIFIHEGSKPRLTGNICRYNPWAGVAIKGEDANPMLIGNTFENNGTWGIRVWGLAQPELDNNTTDNNGVGGIKEVTAQDY